VSCFPPLKIGHLEDTLGHSWFLPLNVFLTAFSLFISANTTLIASFTRIW